MKRAFLLLFSLTVLVAGCNESLKGAPAKPLLPGHAFVTIKKGNLFLSTTRYDNASAMDYLRCRHSQGDQYYVDARRFVTKMDGSVEDRMITFFFPITSDTTEGVRVQWTHGDVQLLGKLPPFRSLGSVLAGSCDADMHLSGNHLVGNITCRNFQNNDPGGIGQFDLEISDLTCFLD